MRQWRYFSKILYSPPCNFTKISPKTFFTYSLSILLWMVLFSFFLLRNRVKLKLQSRLIVQLGLVLVGDQMVSWLTFVSGRWIDILPILNNEHQKTNWFLKRISNFFLLSGISASQRLGQEGIFFVGRWEGEGRGQGKGGYR